jgi:hypothetical protein
VNTTRSIIDLDGAPWNDVTERMRARGHRAESWKVKLLAAPDGARTQLAWIIGEAAPHIHTKASSGYIFAGSMELRGHVCCAGTWFLEPYGAIHPRTTFRDVIYGFGMREGGFGNNGNIALDDVDDLPPWADEIGAKPDDLRNAVDAAHLPWEPWSDRIRTKILHVFERSSWFASMLEAEAGATLPRRRYVGPTDMYVMSGRAQFGDEIAERGAWIHEPAGAEDDVVTFPIETVLLVNTYGTVLEYDAAGMVTRIIDGYALRGDRLAQPHALQAR